MTTLRIHEISVRVFHFTAFCEPNVQYGLTVEDGYRGAFNWDVGGGILLDRWGSGISKSIDVRRGGGFSSVSGGQIYLDNNTGLYDFLQKNNLNLEGCCIEIRFANLRIMTGVVSGIERGISEIAILYDDPSRYRNAIISKRMDNGEFAPAVFGSNIRAKFPSMGVTAIDVLGFEFEHLKEEVYSDKVGRTIIFKLHKDDPILAALLGIKTIVEVGMRNFYAYCVHGNGKGNAIQISGILIGETTWSGADYREIVIQLNEYVNVDPEGVTEFMPVTRYVGDEVETPGPEDYHRISVFKIYYVRGGFVSDAWEFGGAWLSDTIYAYENGNWLPVVREGLLDVTSSGDIRLVPNKYSSDFESVDYFCELEGVDFKFNSAPYASGVEYDRAVFDLFAKEAGPSQRWYADPRVFSNVYDTGNLAWYINPPSQNSAPGSLAFAFLEPPARVVTGRNHDTKVIVDLPTSAGNLQSGQGIPFDFSFKEVSGIQEIKLNYDLVLNMGFDPDQGGGVIPFEDILTDFAKSTGGRVFYHLITTVTSAPRGLLAGRDYPMSCISFESFVGAGNSRVGTVIAQRLNTSYNLSGFNDAAPASSVYNLDAAYGWLLNNGSFWRQDFAFNPAMLRANLNGGHTQYLSGKDVIYTNSVAEGTPGFALSDIYRPHNNPVINFRALLGFQYRWSNVLAGKFLQSVEFKNIQCFAELSISPSENLYADVNGREDGQRVSINTLATLYKHVLRLQNYENAHSQYISRPPGGWGSAYSFEPYADSIVIDPYTLDYLPSMLLKRQLFTETELSSQNIKRELLRTAWFGGSINAKAGAGIEIVFNILNPHGRAQIAYADIVPESLSGLKSPNKADIFCQIGLNYDFQAGPDEFRRKIQVIGIDTENPQVIGENELTVEQKNELLEKCQNLFTRYGVINDAPKELTENKWLYRDEDAFLYLQKWLEWMGEGDTSFIRAEANFRLPVRVAIEKSIDVGRGVTVEIPRLGGTFDGIITSVSWSFAAGREDAQCTAFLKLPTAPGGSLIIDEQGDNTTDIIETGAHSGVFDEGGL